MFFSLISLSVCISIFLYISVSFSLFFIYLSVYLFDRFYITFLLIFSLSYYHFSFVCLFLLFLFLCFFFLWGPYKRAYIAAPQRLLQLAQRTSRNTRQTTFPLVYCRALRQPQCTISTCCGCHSLPEWVEFSLPQHHNISPFIPSRFFVSFCSLNLSN